MDDVDAKLRSQLLAQLRVSDEAVVLPQAHVSAESKTLKNVVMRLCGSEAGPQPELFSASWFCGVSLVQVPKEKAALLLSDGRARQSALAKLREVVPSEMADSQLQVGPDISCDEQDRDCDNWVAGFDGPNCCVGLYSATQSRAPDSTDGMSRVHHSYYLACKAGGGLAAQTFHARLTASLRQGASLDEALSEEGSPGAKALRRVARAAKRNRGRILVAVAEALGFFGVDTIGDNASPSGRPYRIAVPTIDCTYNSLARVDDGSASRSVWQYASGCVDAAVSTGVVSCSNVAEGFVAFTTAEGGARIHLKNDAYSCIPFCSVRRTSNRDAVLKAVEAHKRAKAARAAAHPDHAWVADRFTWKAKQFMEEQPSIEPPCLWGTHCSEAFLAEWARELGVSRASPIRLHPEVVVVSSVEQGKLRVATKAVAQA